MTSREEEIKRVHMKWDMIDIINRGNPTEIVQVFQSDFIDTTNVLSDVLIEMSLNDFQTLVNLLKNDDIHYVSTTILRLCPFYNDVRKLGLVTELFDVPAIYESLDANVSHTFAECVELWNTMKQSRD